MHVRQQTGIIPAVNWKDRIDDHNKKLRYAVKNYICYHSFLCVIPLQRNPHLSSAMVHLLRTSFATENLHTIHKTFRLTHPTIDKSKFVVHPSYTVIIKRF